MSPIRLALLTSLTMVAFAANSVLCRLALRSSAIDAASFTTIRLISGALMLWLVCRWKKAPQAGAGNWISAVALLGYAAGFSFAYLSLPAGTGALLLFGAVQATMIGYGIATGERLRVRQTVGLALALAGLGYLLLPGVSAPPFGGALLMLGAGVAWGVYSLRGKGKGNPTVVTAGNFLRGVPLALVLTFLTWPRMEFNGAGVGYAIASGAIASGLGYACWYSILPALKATTAATVQLSVPVIAALGGIAFLGETLTLRLVLAAFAVLCGIAMVVMEKRPAG